MEGAAKQKSKYFAIRIVKLYRFLTDEKREFVMAKQLLRSGTSIGANLAEAECAISKKDFLAKVYIALKECAETEYWIEMMAGCNAIIDETARALLQECGIIRRMLAKSITTAKGKIEERT